MGLLNWFKPQKKAKKEYTYLFELPNSMEKGIVTLDKLEYQKEQGLCLLESVALRNGGTIVVGEETHHLINRKVVKGDTTITVVQIY